jgi:FemAB-related protein (PEP-CTERM system-associated)
MTRIVEYEDSFRERWSAFIDKTPSATIAHQIGWKNVVQRGLGHKPFFLVALSDDTIRGVLPLFLVRTFWGSRYLISVPWIDYGGVCADDPEAENTLFDEVRRLAQAEKAQFVEFRSADAVYDRLPVDESKVTFLLELNENPEIILKTFDSKLRNQIRKAQKSEITAEFGGVEKLPDFYKIFSWKMHSLGTPVWGFSFFENILTTFPDTAKLIIVKKDEKPVAGGLLLSFKDRLYVPSAASYDSALKYCPNHALYWEVIKKGCRENYRYFDFGRSRIDSSTYNFKKQWVPAPTQLKWQYYLARTRDIPAINPSSPKYSLFINIWKMLPLSVANYLGPRIIRNFP